MRRKFFTERERFAIGMTMANWNAGGGGGIAFPGGVQRNIR